MAGSSALPRWCLVLAFVLGFCGNARAQFGGFAGPSYDHYAMPATPQEVLVLARDAGLDEAGREAALALVRGCQGALERGNHRYQRAWEKAYLNQPFEDRAPLREKSKKLLEERQRVHDEAAAALISDLRSLVPTEKDEAWAAFERRRHRRLYLPMSIRPGVGVDLVEIAERAKAAERPEVKEVLGPYERKLDGLLVSRFPIALTYDEQLQAAVTKGDEREAERLYNAMRDADCAILHLQRETGRRLLEATPEDGRGEMRDLLLVGRSNAIQTKPPVRMRAEKLVKSGRLEAAKREMLERAIRQFDERSRPLDEGYLMRSEDEECAQTYAKSRERREDAAGRAWISEGNRIQAELLGVIEKVATEEDLEAVEGR